MFHRLLSQYTGSSFQRNIIPLTRFLACELSFVGTRNCKAIKCLLGPLFKESKQRTPQNFSRGERVTCYFQGRWNNVAIFWIFPRFLDHMLDCENWVCGRGGWSHIFQLRFFPNFWIRVRNCFKFVNPIPVQTPVTTSATKISNVCT